ncbi:MAG TPA: hypothetical protein VGB68_19720 [Pyrinomonadaceae bacterium]|jgi:hypothetical protein
MNLIIPTLVFVKSPILLPPSTVETDGDGASASENADAVMNTDANINTRSDAANAARLLSQLTPPPRPLPAFSDSSIDHLPELSLTHVRNFYDIVKNRRNELDFSKLRIWLVMENIFSNHQPVFSEDLEALREQIDAYLNIPTVEINILALVKNRMRVSDQLQISLQKAARENIADYILLLNNSNLDWTKSGNVVQLTDEEFYNYGLQMIEYIHFANIMLDDVAFPFNSLNKRRFYFTISSSFKDFFAAGNSQNKLSAPVKEQDEIFRFPDAVRDCLESFFKEAFKFLQKINQADVFHFLGHRQQRDKARQSIFRALQSEHKTRDDLLNSLYRELYEDFFKNIEQIFTLLTALAVFETGLLRRFKKIKDFIASSNDLEKSKEILPEIINNEVIKKINDAREARLRHLRLEPDRSERDSWQSETESLWQYQFNKNRHAELRRVFKRNLEIIKHPEKAPPPGITAVAAEDFFKPPPIEYKEGTKAKDKSKPEDLIKALRHILKMVLKSAFENPYMTVQKKFLILDKNRIKDAESLDDLNDAYLIYKQLEKFKDFLSAEQIDKNKFLEEAKRNFEALTRDYLSRAEMTDYTAEIMTRDVADLLYSALNHSKRNQAAARRPTPGFSEKKIEELPAFFRAPSGFSSSAAPVLSVIFTGEETFSAKENLRLIQNINHQDQKFSLFGPWDEQTCFVTNE